MINFLGLVLALLPTYLIRFHIFGIPTTLLEVLLVVFFLFALLKFRLKDYHDLARLDKLNWAIGLFVLAGLISTIISPDKIHALGQLKAFIIEPILFFYACVLLIKTDEHKKIALRWLFVSAGLISLFGLLQYYTFLNLPIRFWGNGDEVTRITSVFEYPNALALYLAPLFVFFLSLRLHKFELFKKPWVVPAGLIAMGIALIFTFSRGAWAAIIIVLALLALKRFSWKKILIPAVIVIVVLLFIPAVFQRIKLGITDPSSQAHFDLMAVGMNKVLQSPFVGNGLAGFPNTLKQANFPGEILNYPHNIFLNFWLELGLLGLIAFAWIIFLISEQHKKHPTIFTIAGSMFLLVLILHGLVDAPYFKNDLAVLFWFMIALFYI